MRLPLLLPILIFFCKFTFAQDSSKLDKAITLPTKFFAALDKKTASIENKLDKQTGKYLDRLQKQEHKLRKKLWKKDSTLAKQLFDGTDDKYAQLKNLDGNVGVNSSIYSGHLDSLTTSLKLLQAQNSNSLELQQTLAQYSELQQKLNASDEIKKYMVQRRELLREQFEKLGMVREIKEFRKQVYYYQAQVAEYKEAIKDPNKLEEKLLSLVQTLPQFKSFFARNSMLGNLFALPGGNSTSTASLAGLQTRAMVTQSLSDRFGSGANVTQMLQQNVQAGQDQLAQLKSKASSYSNGTYGKGNDNDLPGFKPNNQKTKSFLERLELGTNVQSQKARYFFPVTSDLGLSLGYRMNDKSLIGIGASYKIGWGSSWNNLRLSSQGVGLRSFLDWKLKGSIYLSGGYEQNYRNLITSIDQLKNYSAWQSSGLVGLSKKYALGKKTKGEMKLLWDFLSYQQIPKTQPIVFRIGYSFK